MPGNQAIPWAATAVAVVILLASGCSRAPRLDSHWPAASIHVDGADTDWSDRRYVLETLNVTVAVANDSNYLYLCAVTSDCSVQRQVVRRGIELWIDPKGGSKTYFGVRVPGADGEGQNNPRTGGNGTANRRSVWPDGWAASQVRARSTSSIQRTTRAGGSHPEPVARYRRSWVSTRAGLFARHACRCITGVTRPSNWIAPWVSGCVCQYPTGRWEGCRIRAVISAVAEMAAVSVEPEAGAWVEAGERECPC